ncbi:unnamed protein product [Blepharisma stoltei]|uniref:Uncharacterized protein n=1 Tax=Blepharisma stoltei TaxID=1481888 RepID=A0AAU9K1I0_9CILI|nr:unnamed protein product [Blepharisma stoltei]
MELIRKRIHRLKKLILGIFFLGISLYWIFAVYIDLYNSEASTIDNPEQSTQFMEALFYDTTTQEEASYKNSDANIGNHQIDDINSPKNNLSSHNEAAAIIQNLTESTLPCQNISISNPLHEKIISLPLLPSINLKNPNITCNPPIFSYKPSQIALKFPYAKRKFSCGEEGDIFMIQENNITINCEEGENPEISLGTDPEDELLESPLAPKWKAYKDAQDIGRTEFGFAKCGSDKRQGFLHNKFSKSASKRAQERRKATEKKAKMTEPSKPLTVLVIVFDSVSRQHFYRMLAETVSFMNNSIASGAYAENFALYDFQIEHSIYINTMSNIIPLLLGKPEEDAKAKVKGLKLANNYQEDFAKNQKDALWKYYENFGFVTMFGWENRSGWLSKIIGRKVLADHVVNNLYSSAGKLVGLCLGCLKEMCLGNHYSHQYLFNYTKEFIENYKGHHKFAYNHYDTGHEDTGSVIKTADSDLASLLKDILDFHSKNNEELALFLTSDHGLGVGIWSRNEEGIMEHLLPFNFLIASKSLIEKLGPDTHENLLHNTQHLTSKQDTHLSLKHLAYAPYKKITKKSQEYKNLKNGQTALSLFLEKIKDDRNCKDIGSGLEWCACLDYKEISLEDYKDLAERIADQGAIEINKKHKNERVTYYCATIEVGEVIEIKRENIENVKGKYSGVYKVTFSEKNHPNYMVTVIAIVLPSDEAENYEEEGYWYTGYAAIKLDFNGKLLSVRPIQLIRADEDEDYCLEWLSSFRWWKRFCLCTSSKNYNITSTPSQKDKNFYEKLLKIPYMVIGESGKSCNEACNKESRFCQKWGLEVTNNIELLKEPWKNQINSYKILMDGEYKWLKDLKIKDIEAGDVPGLKYQNGTYRFVQGNWDNLSCNSEQEGVRPICACSAHKIEVS